MTKDWTKSLDTTFKAVVVFIEDPDNNLGLTKENVSVPKLLANADALSLVKPQQVSSPTWKQTLKNKIIRNLRGKTIKMTEEKEKAEGLASRDESRLAKRDGMLQDMLSSVTCPDKKMDIIQKMRNMWREDDEREMEMNNMRTENQLRLADSEIRTQLVASDKEVHCKVLASHDLVLASQEKSRSQLLSPVKMGGTAMALNFNDVAAAAADDDDDDDDCYETNENKTQAQIKSPSQRSEGRHTANRPPLGPSSNPQVKRGRSPARVYRSNGKRAPPDSDNSSSYVPKKKKIEKSTSTSNSNPFNSDVSAFPPRSDLHSWMCDICLVRNNDSANQCIACETPRPGAEGFSFGGTTVADTKATASSIGAGGFSFGGTIVADTKATASAIGAGGFSFGEAAFNLFGGPPPGNVFGAAGQFSSASATTSSRQAGIQGNLFGGPLSGNLFGAAGQFSSASASASATPFVFGAPSQQSSTRTTAFGASLHPPPPAASTAEDNMDVNGSSPDEIHV